MVEVDGGDPLPVAHQGDGEMHPKGRFPGTALLVADHDDMRGNFRLALVCTNMPPTRYRRPLRDEATGNEATRHQAALPARPARRSDRGRHSRLKSSPTPSPHPEVSHQEVSIKTWPACAQSVSQRADAVNEFGAGSLADIVGGGQRDSGLSPARARSPVCAWAFAALPATSESIGELSPSSATATRTTSEATSLMRSRSTALAMRSDAQMVSTCFFIDLI